jgi:hypothetical protein
MDAVFAFIAFSKTCMVVDRSVEIACEIRRDDDARIDGAEADVAAEHVDGLIDALQFETAAFTERRDKIAARGSLTLVQDAELHVGDRRVHHRPEQHELEDWRQDQRRHDSPIAFDLIQLLLNERAKPGEIHRLRTFMD